MWNLWIDLGALWIEIRYILRPDVARTRSEPIQALSRLSSQLTDESHGQAPSLTTRTNQTQGNTRHSSTLHKLSITLAVQSRYDTCACASTHRGLEATKPRQHQQRKEQQHEQQEAQTHVHAQ